MKRLIPLILVAAILFTLAGCSCGKIKSDPGEAPDVHAPDATPTPTPTPTPFYDPLTGEVTETDITSQRPYAVMINNISVAQPHCGTGSAAILYEILAEGEITRFEAIYSDLNGVGAIGSVRSARPYYIEVALSYDALFVHAGGSEQAYSDIVSKGVDDMDGVRGMDFTNGYFYRDNNRKGGIEHRMFTTSDLILAHTSDIGYTSTHDSDYDYGMTFTDGLEMTASGEAATSVGVSFSGLKSTNFTYDPITAEYSMEQFGNTYIDGNTGETVLFKNVLVLFAESQIIDSDGRRTVDLDGTGEGYFCCNGKYVPITWKHGGTGTKWQYTLEDGTPLKFGVGSSYIGIVPTGSKITIA